MSFALGWEGDEIQGGGLLFFDAITSWNRSYTGQVTKHPVNSGANITDHFVKNNPIFTMSAVISGVDVSVAPDTLRTESESAEGGAGDKPYNTRKAPAGVSVGSDSSLLMKYIPNVIGQFLPDKLPEVTMEEPRQDTAEEIQDILVSLQSGEGFSLITGIYQTNIRAVNLYETDGGVTLVKKLPASNSFLVITSINFKEDPDSGYALFADITFEQVTFATSKKVKLDPDVVAADQKSRAAEKKGQGKVDSTETDAETPEVLPADRQSVAKKALESGKSILEGIRGASGL